MSANLINEKVELVCRFTSEDVSVVEDALKCTQNIILRSSESQNEVRLREQTQRLRHVAQNIFRKLDDLPILLREIIQEAEILHSQKSLFFFILVLHF